MQIKKVEDIYEWKPIHIHIEKNSYQLSTEWSRNESVTNLSPFYRKDLLNCLQNLQYKAIITEDKEFFPELLPLLKALEEIDQ